MIAYGKYSLHIFLNISIILISFFISPMSTASIYKWVDADGTVHYGAQRPADAPSEKIKVQRHAPQKTSTYKRPGEKTTEEENADTAKEDAESKTEQEPEKKIESSAEKKRRLAACSQAKKNLATMQSVGRIRSQDKDGNTAFLSQPQKEGRMKRARDLISTHCK